MLFSASAHTARDCERGIEILLAMIMSDVSEPFDLVVRALEAAKHPLWPAGIIVFLHCHLLYLNYT